jgi:hypothetical protein
MFEPKVPAIGASIGFVVSLLVGIFSGSSFSVVLLRAGIMAAMFAVLTLVVKFLVVKFLPELLSSAESDDTLVDDTGNAVNITIGENEREENPFAGVDTASDGSMVPDFLQNASRAELSSRVEDFELDEIPHTTATSSVPNTGIQPAEGGSRVSVSAETPRASSLPRTAGGLDVLPDLDDFLPQARERVNAGDEDEGTQPSEGDRGESRFQVSDLKASAVESETMARAIRTILTKDA